LGYFSNALKIFVSFPMLSPLFNGSCLLNIFTKKSIDYLVRAHEKENNFMNNNNNDICIALKIDYSTTFDFMEVQLALIYNYLILNLCQILN